jgi:hypothetical protein
MPKQMVVKEVEMAARKALNLCKCVINLLNIERLAALIKGIFIAEVAVVRAAPGDNNAIGNKIKPSVD